MQPSDVMFEVTHTSASPKQLEKLLGELISSANVCVCVCVCVRAFMHVCVSVGILMKNVALTMQGPL